MKMRLPWPANPARSRKMRANKTKSPALAFVLLMSLSATAQKAVEFAPRELKKLSVEELMNVEVTLVSRKPEKLTEAASAIQVITNEDIRRSGATNVAEALRLSPNLQVAQLSSSVWLISARGFNSIFSNKLLVMIDGRTVYTPLYGGVLWEQQNVLLEDVDRIEVVSGPGGTMWGANAVNGVINIVTKQTSETKGLYASASVGTFVKDMAALRYGTNLGSKASLRVYAQHFDRDSTSLHNRKRNSDAWNMTHAGFRLDWNASTKDVMTVQGEYYDGRRKTKPSKSPLNGQHLLARWARVLSPTSDLSLQLYYDRYYRADAPTASSDKINTIDADFQHRFQLSKMQSIVWGTGYRYVKDDAHFTNNSGAGILPRFKRLDLFNAFLQDEILIMKDLRFVVGTKLLHNVYTGWELQPNARLAWQTPASTVWAAVSRAVRTPSRFDVDYFLPLTPQPPNVVSVAGGPNFISEKLVAYEAGYRVQPNKRLSLSLSAFYNVYKDVYSVEFLPSTLTLQIQNGSKAQSWGSELLVNYQLFRSWRLRGGYTFFAKDIFPKEGHVFNPDYLGNDARNQGMIQSILDLPLHLQLDIMARYLDPLAKTFATAYVPSYQTVDARLAYVHKGLELAVVGQNLGQKRHTEFGTFAIPRSVYAKISARF